MFKFNSISQVARRACVALALVVSFSVAVLPNVVMAAPVADQHSRGGSSCANTYVVQRGDTLSGIAARYGVSLRSLSNTNGIGNIDHIYTGQYICVTGSYQGGYQSGHQVGYQGRYQGGYQGGNRGSYQGGHLGRH